MQTPEPAPNGFPDNPVLARVWRGGAVESVHRGAWCLVDAAGEVLEAAGRWEEPFYARSSIKCLQALPLLESGAAERFSFTDAELALAMASHNGEHVHTEGVEAVLARLGLGEADLRCGPQAPDDPEVRLELKTSGAQPGQLHNNCSGKHAGFLALALHLGDEPQRYLEPESKCQSLVRATVAEFTDLDPAALTAATDGCSAPTYRLPLARLALAFARFTNPAGLAPERRAHCERMTEAVRKNPVHIAGRFKRVDTDIVAATDGRLFPKIGAEAVYAVGVCGGERALALKIDDGGPRGLHAVLLALLERLELASADELDRLNRWRDATLRNRAGLEVGRIEPTPFA